MGHAFSGTIAELDGNVDGLVKGSKVVINPLINCCICDRCRKGFENLCDKRKIVGIHRSGAFAELVAVPKTSITVLPDSIDFNTAALAEPLACSLDLREERYRHTHLVMYLYMVQVLLDY